MGRCETRKEGTDKSSICLGNGYGEYVMTQNSEGSWKRFLATKYGFHREGWDIQEPNPCESTLWRNIVSIKEAFNSKIPYHVDPG